MRSVYRVLAILIAVEVAVQAAAMVYAIAGLGLYVEDGGVLDQAAFESGDTLFPEMTGLVLHGVNGMFAIPALALILLVVSFFAKVPGGVRTAAGVLVLVVVQVLLGIFLHTASWLGILHGLNALVLFGGAVSAARLATRADVPAQARPRQSALR
jgi:hypothetical protein